MVCRATHHHFDPPCALKLRPHRAELRIKIYVTLAPRRKRSERQFKRHYIRKTRRDLITCPCPAVRAGTLPPFFSACFFSSTLAGKPVTIYNHISFSKDVGRSRELNIA